MKETEVCTNKWKITICSWIERIDIVEIAMLQKVIYRFNKIPFKILVEFFIELEKIILKFVWKLTNP